MKYVGRHSVFGTTVQRPNHPNGQFDLTGFAAGVRRGRSVDSQQNHVGPSCADLGTPRCLCRSGRRRPRAAASLAVMAKKKKDKGVAKKSGKRMNKALYETELYRLQAELVEMQLDKVWF